MNINIQEILEKYTEYYQEEENDLLQLKNFINNCNNIYSSSNTIGHITASGYIYAKEDRKILLLEHKKLNKLLQPGGHAEKVDRSLIDTARREIFEETGLRDLEMVSFFSDKNIPFDINTHFIPENNKKNMPAHYHHDFRYLFVIEKSRNITIDLAESNSYVWLPIEELEENLQFKKIINKIYNILCLK